MATAEVELRPEVENLIKNVSEEQGINNYVITDVQTNQKGEGYLGEIFMVTIKDIKSNQTVDIIIKAAFTDEKVREIGNIRSSFQNEIYFYSKIYPIFEKFDREHGIAQSVPMVPKCLLVCEDEKNEMLALENLKSSGFEIFDKKLVLDDNHIRLIFETYGRFHGHSYAFQDQQPEEYAKIIESIHNVWKKFMDQGFFADHLAEMGKLAEKTLIPGEDDEVIKKFQEYSGRNIANIFEDISTNAANCDHSTIIHGDCWSNNMLFKYKDAVNDRKPVDMRLIDFQIIMVGSPVCDLSYCLYSGASKKDFDKLNEYLQIYYDSFSSVVKGLGSDPEKLYPFSVLKEQWRKFSKFGMIMAFGILRMKLTEKEDLIDLRDGFEMDELMEKFQKSKFREEDYNERIRGLLWHMSEIGAL